MFKSGKRLPNKRTKRLTDGSDILQHLRIIHTICFIHLPLQIQWHRCDQQRRRAIAVFADGNGADAFTGYYDNTEIYQKMASLVGVQ